jgi:hypothetical protein
MKITGLLVLLAAGLLAGCGETATTTPRATTPATTSASATPAPTIPPGGPPPAQLLGTWHQQGVSAGQAADLTILATRYGIDQGGDTTGGQLVVNGDEIDFFNEDPGSPCDVKLPPGRYRWTLTNGTLHFMAINMDPCGRRTLLSDQNYVKAGA